LWALYILLGNSTITLRDPDLHFSAPALKSDNILGWIIVRQ
jgi:hypothetical protein